MKKLLLFLLTASLTVTGCTAYQKARLDSLLSQQQKGSAYLIPPKTSLINEAGATVMERIDTPPGFERVSVEEGSFGEYLRRQKLKPHGSPVLLYDGREKPAQVHIAVLDIDVGERDLQQCADAVMRLWSEYLYSRGEYDRIHFNFSNGFKAEYAKWMEGYRIAVSGNQTSWIKRTDAANDYKIFRKYLDMVFAYAGTASLSKELEPVVIGDMKIGDVFIKGGSPGHCVIVLDMAEKESTGEKVFLLAQSYMPAQEIHILQNPQNQSDNPWYSLGLGEQLDTPEWDFSAEQLMRFK